VDNSPAFPRATGPQVSNNAPMPKLHSVETLPTLPDVDVALATALLSHGMLSGDQLDKAKHYGVENHRDLRQSILELSLISPEMLNALAFQHLAALSQAGNGTVPVVAEGPPPPLSPDNAKYQRDIRNEIRDLAASAPLSELVTQILERAIDCRATDIHFDPQENGLRVRFRIDGQLQDIAALDPGLTTPMISRIKVMSNLNIVERRHSQDGRITIPHLGRPRDLRVATFPTALGEKIVIRVHETMSEGLAFENLGMSPAQAEQIGSLIVKPYGAFLVAGPVGAGKTSTLYSCLGKVNLPSRNVMTIEDPIEYRIPGVNQTQVDVRGDMRFSDGLKAMLRQDPDVIMIGEIRDDETAKIGIRAALTGVLVFSTIHASDCPGTIGNLYNFGIPGYQLSSSLLAIISQRLIRKVCPYCRVNYTADAKTIAALGLDPADNEGLTLVRGVGCPACFQTGYLGRTGIFEIMEINDELRELVFQQIPKDILRRVAVDLGMQTLKSSAVDKVLEGVTTVEEVYRVVSM
jgi:type II secretory ATPase GspE/PulE/Tfp pilus assembly ATPase PilB-like protein